MDDPTSTEIKDQSSNGTAQRILHRGVVVYVVDYSKAANSKELLAALEEVADYVRTLPGKANSVTDVRGVPADFAFAKRSYRLGKELFTPKSLRSAIVGITGIKKQLFKAYCLISGAQMRAFDTMEQALDYVVTPLD
jgi:hypothetical protein